MGCVLLYRRTTLRFSVPPCDRLDRFSPIVAPDQMDAKAVRDDDAPVGLLAVDLRLEIPVLSLKAQ